jgi:hypothetical protein
VIQVKFLYNGCIEAMHKFSARLQALNPLTSESKSIPWLGASEAVDWGFSSFSNQKGVSVYRFPVGATSFSYVSMKATYDNFAAGLIAQPAFAYSFVIWEAYSTQAVKAVPDAATAVADRADDMLVAAMVIYPPGSGLDDEAEKFGQTLRSNLLDGGEWHAYVNYAHGDEPMESVYGRQKWRLEKLRTMKNIYDPNGRFGFYSPIV